LNKDKITVTANEIMQGLLKRRFTADETICLIKCLDKITQSQAVDHGLVVTTKKQIMEVINGHKNINQLGV